MSCSCNMFSAHLMTAPSQHSKVEACTQATAGAVLRRLTSAHYIISSIPRLWCITQLPIFMMSQYVTHNFALTILNHYIFKTLGHCKFFIQKLTKFQSSPWRSQSNHWRWLSWSQNGCGYLYALCIFMYMESYQYYPSVLLLLRTGSPLMKII